MDKYNRSDFMDQNIVNGIPELDFMTNKWSEFKFNRPGTYYTIQDRDLQRPDLVSFIAYGKVNYWWIISKVNNIDDWFNDLAVGEVILLPNKLDIEDFFIESTIKK